MKIVSSDCRENCSRCKSPGRCLASRQVCDHDGVDTVTALTDCRAYNRKWQKDMRGGEQNGGGGDTV